MGELDLDAVKARAATAKRNALSSRPLDLAAYQVLATLARTDVPALLVRLAEVEAERDAALADAEEFEDALDAAVDDLEPRIEAMTKHAEALAAENARLRQDVDEWARAKRWYELRAELEAVTAERDKLKTDTERLARRLAGRYEETVGLRTEIDWMRPVVEAAEEWLVDIPLGPERNMSDAEIHLELAVDAYRAAQKAPLDRPESTESQDLHPGDARDTPDGREAHKPAEAVHEIEALSLANDWRCSCGASGRGDATNHIKFWTGPTKTDEPADPPGLDAAIEVGSWALAESIVGYRSAPGDDAIRHAAATIRAAAPALRAGALRAEADSLIDEIRLQSSWLWYELGESALEKLAQRLRERADRIGGAT